ncbi:MAG: leucine-rich repeat domain-containing protein, partial [Clostridia bacterium]|nr:leucine-rich repeat domain-containing protein [Clostridia bacterium]
MMFDHCSNLRTVLIKEGTNITQLPESMFSECKNLESFVVEGENSIVSIGSGFNMITGNNGSKLARFDLGTNTTLKIIGMGVFGSYKGNELTDANFNLGTLESLETIGERAFWGCGKITTLDFSKAKLTSFGKDAFYTCGALTTVKLPSTLKEIGEGAFEGCYSLTSINIPEGVTTISNSAFNSCYSLTNVIIPSTVTAIEGSAFTGCFSIESTITITKDMVVDISAFEESGFRFEVSSDNTTYKAVGGALYSYDLSTLYRMAPKHMGETFEIPEGVTTIYEYALSDYVRFYFALEQGVEKPALNIKTITLPSTLVTIGDGAFYYLHTLENLEMPSVVAIETIGEYAFAGCESLTSFIIPSRVTTISPRLFTETGLTEIIIHSGITTIENDVFDGCESLTRIIVEEGCIITELTEEMVGDVYNNVEIVYNNTTTE